MTNSKRELIVRLVQLILFGAVVIAGCVANAQSKADIKLLVYKKALEHRLDPDLVMAIVAQESRFVVSAYNKKSRDYGLMQINVKNVEKLSLDKSKLLKDASYNLDEGLKILKWFHTRYKGEKLWYCRYNVGVATLDGPTPARKRCVRYAAQVQKRMVELQIADLK